MISLAALVACKKGENAITLPFSENVRLLPPQDTFSIEMSTVLVDSVLTSNSNQIISGHYNDDVIGEVNTSSYFELSLNGKSIDGDGFETIILSPSTPVYDSLVLVLPCSYFYHGDTSASRRIGVHRVTELIRSKGGAGIYNGTYYNYDPKPLAEAQISNLQPGNSFRIKLDDELGKEILQLAINKDFRVTTNTYFKDYLKGLALIPDKTSQSVYGYINPYIRLYYHDTTDPALNYSYDFIHLNGDKYFNRIQNDRSNTLFKPLQNIYNEISIDKTNGNTAVLGGIELMTKFSFPYLGSLAAAYPGGFLINRARLVIYTKQDDNLDKRLSLPGHLSMYKTNNLNIPLEQLYYSGTTSPQVISPVTSTLSGDAYYSFDVTDFVNQKLNGDATAALLLAVPPYYTSSQPEKLILEKANSIQGKRIKLIIYLTVL